MTKLPVSIILIAKNEEHNLEDCLNSCSFASEIILVDDNSEDKTVEIAKKFGARVFTRALNGDWGSQQTFAIQQATMPWLFLIDADERCSDALCEEIKKAVDSGDKYAYLIRRENRFHHNKATHGVLRADYVSRLLPNDGVTVEGLVHLRLSTLLKRDVCIALYIITPIPHGISITANLINMQH